MLTANDMEILFKLMYKQYFYTYFKIPKLYNPLQFSEIIWAAISKITSGRIKDWLILNIMKIDLIIRMIQSTIFTVPQSRQNLTLAEPQNSQTTS